MINNQVVLKFRTAAKLQRAYLMSPKAIFSVACITLLTNCGRDMTKSNKGANKNQASQTALVKDYLTAYGDDCATTGALSINIGQGGFIAFKTNAQPSTHSLAVQGQVPAGLSVNLAGATLSASQALSVTAVVVLRNMTTCRSLNYQGFDCAMTGGTVAQTNAEFDIATNISFTTRSDLTQYVDESTLGTGQKGIIAKITAAEGKGFWGMLGNLASGSGGGGSGGLDMSKLTGMFSGGKLDLTKVAGMIGSVAGSMGGSNNTSNTNANPYLFTPTDTRTCATAAPASSVNSGSTGLSLNSYEADTSLDLIE